MNEMTNTDVAGEHPSETLSAKRTAKRAYPALVDWRTTGHVSSVKNQGPKVLYYD